MDMMPDAEDDLGLDGGRRLSGNWEKGPELVIFDSVTGLSA
jgi:hypothetical protein